MSDLSIRDQSDFAYLLEMMDELHGIPEFVWLPELFKIIGYERLLNLSKYAGGETITIPTLQELSNSIEVLQWFYDVKIKKSKSISDVPVKFHNMFHKMLTLYNLRNGE